MVGCLANLYASVENLSVEYMQPNQHSRTLLMPKAPSFASNMNLLKLEHAPAATGTRRPYRCGTGYSQCHPHVSDHQSAICPSCRYPMNSEVKLVESAPAASSQSGGEGEGYVKGVVTYMVMDNLEVKPISSITLLNKFNVKDVGALAERAVDVGMAEALEILGASLKSSAVLTSVFLRAKDGSIW